MDGRGRGDPLSPQEGLGRGGVSWRAGAGVEGGGCPGKYSLRPSPGLPNGRASGLGPRSLGCPPPSDFCNSRGLSARLVLLKDVENTPQQEPAETVAQTI